MGYLNYIEDDIFIVAGDHTEKKNLNEEKTKHCHANFLSSSTCKEDNSLAVSNLANLQDPNFYLDKCSKGL